jgi:hypothetical protein
MNPDGSGFLSALMLNRARAAEVVVVAVALAFGVHLLAAYAEAKLSLGGVLIVGAGTVAVGLTYVLARAFWPGSRVRSLAGFFIYDATTSMLVEDDPRYELGYALRTYLQSAFAENAGLKSAWQHSPLAPPPDDENPAGDPTQGRELIRQATEYFVLSHLSTHLGDYFTSNRARSQDLQTLSHTDVPDVLLQNRFMKLFTEPMNERAAFLDETRSSHDDSRV